MNKFNYINKALLSDTNIYTIVKHNPSNKNLRDLKSLLKIGQEFVTDYNYLNSMNTILSNMRYQKSMSQASYELLYHP